MQLVQEGGPSTFKSIDQSKYVVCNATWTRRPTYLIVQENHIDYKCTIQVMQDGSRKEKQHNCSVKGRIPEFSKRLPKRRLKKWSHSILQWVYISVLRCNEGEVDAVDVKQSYNRASPSNQVKGSSSTSRRWEHEGQERNQITHLCLCFDLKVIPKIIYQGIEYRL